MKTVTHGPNATDKLLHIETEGCVINVRIGLSDSDGNRVTSIEIIPEDESRAPDLDGHYWHVDPQIRNVRVIREEKEES